MGANQTIEPWTSYSLLRWSSRKHGNTPHDDVSNIDLNKKAFGSVPSNKFWDILRKTEYGISIHIHQPIQETYQNITNSVIPYTNEEICFRIKTGARHVSVLSALLFILMIDQWSDNLRTAYTDGDILVTVTTERHVTRCLVSRASWPWNRWWWFGGYLYRYMSQPAEHPCARWTPSNTLV